MGFGFGDAVIVELLKNKNAIPDTSVGAIDVVVFAQDPALYPKAIQSATLLRSNGFVVDLVLEQKKLKWVFQRADRLKAGEICTALHVFPFALNFSLVFRCCTHALGERRFKRRGGGQEPKNRRAGEPA